MQQQLGGRRSATRPRAPRRERPEAVHASSRPAGRGRAVIRESRRRVRSRRAAGFPPTRCSEPNADRRRAPPPSRGRCAGGRGCGSPSASGRPARPSRRGRRSSPPTTTPPAAPSAAPKIGSPEEQWFSQSSVPHRASQQAQRAAGQPEYDRPRVGALRREVASSRPDFDAANRPQEECHRKRLPVGPHSQDLVVQAHDDPLDGVQPQLRGVDAHVCPGHEHGRLRRVFGGSGDAARRRAREHTPRPRAGCSWTSSWRRPGSIRGAGFTVRGSAATTGPVSREFQ